MKWLMIMKKEHEVHHTKKSFKELAKAGLTKLVLSLFFISAILILFVSRMINVQMLNYERTVHQMTKNHLKSAALSLSKYISAEELDRFRTIKDMYAPEYNRMKKLLQEFVEEHNIRYAYYWRYYNDGYKQYIIDNDFDLKTQVGLNDIEIIRETAAISALLGVVSIAEPEENVAWEGLITAYAPVFDSEGKIYCIAGVDICETEYTEEMYEHLKSLAQLLSTFISYRELDRFHRIEDAFAPEYYRLKHRLNAFAENYNVLYAYFWRYFGDGKFQYIFDNDFDPKTQVNLNDFEFIEEDVAFAVLSGEIGVTDLGMYASDWEGLITAYAPVFDSTGNIVAVAGVDISDEFIFTQRADAQKMKLMKFIVIPLSLIFAIITMLLYRRKTLQIQDAHTKLQYFNNNLRRAFSTYLSEDVVEEIVSDPTRLQLGGVKKHMTVLFTDVKDFAKIAEMLAPEQLVDLLNYYLSTMSDVILDQKGTIDKYQGDAILSFFGAPIDLPDHALRACVSAVIMKRLEKEINRHIKEKNLCSSPLLTRIGINTGDMVVGNMGTQKKMNYTIIANAVNLAARLEGVNKQYGTWILASEATILETKGRLLTRHIDRIRVVGINEPVRIFEVLEIKADATKAMLEMVYLFHQALSLYEKRKWKKAIEAFSEVLKISPDDTPSMVYIDRCHQYIESPPSLDWDGVFNLTKK